jgi:hypothetical protein
VGSRDRIFETVAAISLRREITGEWLLLLRGILSVAFGRSVILVPVAGAVGIAGSPARTQSLLATSSSPSACGCARASIV